MIIILNVFDPNIPFFQHPLLFRSGSPDKSFAGTGLSAFLVVYKEGMT